jgi:hypothetical protein
MNLAAFVQDLRQQGMQLTAQGNRLDCRGPGAILTPTIKAQLATYKWPLLNWLKQEIQQPADPPTPQSNKVEQLQKRIQTARDWFDLSVYLKEAEIAYHQGKLIQSQVEALTRLAIVVSRTVPKHAGNHTS